MWNNPLSPNDPRNPLHVVKKEAEEAEKEFNSSRSSYQRKINEIRSSVTTYNELVDKTISIIGLNMAISGFIELKSPEDLKKKDLPMIVEGVLNSVDTRVGPYFKNLVDVPVIEDVVGALSSVLDSISGGLVGSMVSTKKYHDASKKLDKAMGQADKKYQEIQGQQATLTKLIQQNINEYFRIRDAFISVLTDKQDALTKPDLSSVNTKLLDDVIKLQQESYFKDFASVVVPFYTLRNFMKIEDFASNTTKYVNEAALMHNISVDTVKTALQIIQKLGPLFFVNAKTSGSTATVPQSFFYTPDPSAPNDLAAVPTPL